MMNVKENPAEIKNRVNVPFIQIRFISTLTRHFYQV